MLRINRQTDYAVRVVLALAKRGEGARLSSTDIQQEMLIPKAFMTRIVAQLSREGLINTFPGREGGLMLPRPASQITLRDVVEAFEGPILLSACLQAKGEDDCPFRTNCPVSPKWGRVQVAMMREMASLRATARVPAPTVFFVFSIGGVLAGLPSLAQPWSLPPAAWLAAGAVGVTSFLAQLAMTEAYGQLSVPEAALWQQLTPISSYLWASTLGESVTSATALGILLGVGGVVYGSAFGHRPTEASRIAQAAPEIPGEEP